MIEHPWIWDGDFTVAAWEHKPTGPYLLMFDGPIWEKRSALIRNGNLRKALARFMEERKDSGPGSMAVVVDSTSTIIHGFVWLDTHDHPIVAGCSAVFDEIRKLGTMDPVDTAFVEMTARGDLADLEDRL